MKSKLTLVSFLLLLYIGPMIFISSYIPSTILAEPHITKDFSIAEEWYDDSWLYRKNVIMYSGLGGLETNYTVKVEVAYDSDMQADFDDVIFTDNDNVTLLDFWRESYIESTSAVFWVKVTDSHEWGTYFMVQMYYGNDAVSTTSDGEATFLFFDDFENNDMDRWTTPGGYWSTVSDRVKYGSYAGFADADITLNDRKLIQDISAFRDSDIMVHLYVQSELETSKEYYFRSGATSAGVAQGLFGENDDWKYDNGPVSNWEVDTYLDDTWFELELAIDYTNSLFRLWIDEASKGTIDLEDIEGVAITWMDDWTLIVDSGEGEDLWIDEAYIRKWVLNEPEFDSFGDKEYRFPPQWYESGDVGIMFQAGWGLVFQFGYNAFFIFLGLIMIPASTMYLAWGGRKAMSTDKLFYGLVIFALGFGFLIGGITP